MGIINMRITCVLSLFFLVTAFVPAQDEGGSFSRGSIPEELLRPKRGEAPYYPVDIVIGELGRGEASEEAYSFARSIAAGFLSGEMGHPALETVNIALRGNYHLALETIQPSGFRLGGGKEEPDGAISFLIRFVGKELGITGELFVRYVTKQTERIIKGEEDEEDEVEIITTGRWMFDDMILEDAKNRNEEQRDSVQRFDFSPL